MTVDEGLNWLLQLTVNTALSPFGCGHGHVKTMHLTPNRVPCVKLIDRVGWAPYILFINKNGQPCILARELYTDEDDDIVPMKVISVEDLTSTVRASDRWRQDCWLTDCPDWSVSNWYRENGWPINETHYGVRDDV